MLSAVNTFRVTSINDRYVDLQLYRTDVLKKSNMPLHVIVTRSGKLDPEHLIFQNRSDKSKVLLVTTKEQFSQLKQKFELAKHVEVFALGIDQVDFEELLKLLQHKYKVLLLDLSCGGEIAAQFNELGLISEIRHTITGQLAGTHNSYSQRRPSPFNSKPTHYLVHEAPTLIFKSVRTFQQRHLFVRSLILSEDIS